MSENNERRRASVSERRSTTPKRKEISNPFLTTTAATRREERYRKGGAKPGAAARSAGVTSNKSNTSLSQDRIAEILANPTKTVTEAELRSDYSYVLADLRSMGLLAAGLVVFLVFLAQVLPK